MTTDCPNCGERHTFGRLYVPSDVEDELSRYPLKSHPGAKTKTNIFFRDVCVGLTTHPVIEWIGPSLEGLTNDQASAWLIWAASVEGRIPQTIQRCAVAHAKDAPFLKNMSLWAKQHLTAQNWLSTCVELNTLRGRAVDPVDWKTETARRVGVDVGVRLDLSRLAACIDRVYAENLGGADCTPRAPASWWADRWFWCKNGAHAHWVDSQYHVALKGRVGRRAFAEALRNFDPTAWDGDVRITRSEKLEHGKSRPLYSCDSASYFFFQWLLEPVESNWRGREAVLRPTWARHGAAAIAERWPDDGSVALMADFDDFNSQHTTEAMALVFSRLRAYVGPPADLAAASFSSMRVRTEDGWKRWAGTLPSGHRATTFINTVLNRAYLHMAGVGLPDRVWCVGDDVVAYAPNVATAHSWLDSLTALGLRLQPAKQLVSESHVEFLRTVGWRPGPWPEKSVGYLARSIASLVSGDWVTVGHRTAAARARHYAQAAWTMVNRGADQGAVVCALSASVVRRTGLTSEQAWGLLGARTTVAGSPVRAALLERVPALLPAERVHRERAPLKKYYATEDAMRGTLATAVMALGNNSNVVSQLRRSMQDASSVETGGESITKWYEAAITFVGEVPWRYALTLTPAPSSVVAAAMPFLPPALAEQVAKAVGTNVTTLFDEHLSGRTAAVACGTLPYQVVCELAERLVTPSVVLAMGVYGE